jgi:ABC-type sugar transport system ATPase subunit
MAPERRVAAFSGGNQQKVMLARGLMRPFDVYLFDEPTVGIDVGAKADVYALIKRLVERRRGRHPVQLGTAGTAAPQSSRCYVMSRRPASWPKSRATA